MQIYQGQANPHLALNDFEHALAAGEHWLTLARRTEDRASEGAALESMALASRYAHDLDRALAYARQAIAAAGQVGAASIISGSYLVTGSVHYLTGRLHQARADIDSALRMSRAMGDVTRQSLALYAAGLLRNWEGKFSEASRLQSECLVLARTHGLVPSLVRGYFGYGVTLTGQGEYDAALAVFEEGLALTDKPRGLPPQHVLLNQSTRDWYRQVRRETSPIRMWATRVCECRAVRSSLQDEVTVTTVLHRRSGGWLQSVPVGVEPAEAPGPDPGRLSPVLALPDRRRYVGDKAEGTALALPSAQARRGCLETCTAERAEVAEIKRKIVNLLGSLWVLHVLSGEFPDRY
jgi:tetratricopeptide (TPR) repeat protein